MSCGHRIGGGSNRHFIHIGLFQRPKFFFFFRKTTDHFRGIYRINPNLMKENRRMPSWNRLDLQTLGSQLVMSKDLPDHWFTFESSGRLSVIWEESIEYRNTIASSSPRERIFIYFEKIRFASQKIEFLNFLFQQKININDLKWFRNNKRLQKLIHYIFVFCLHNFVFFTFFYF